VAHARHRFLAGLAFVAVVGGAAAGATPPPRVAVPTPVGDDHPVDATDARPRAETSVAVNPRDPRHVVVTAIQFERAYRDALNNARGYSPDVHIWVSRDGGGTFRAAGGLPALDRSWPASNDPSIAFGPNGTVYASYTSFGGRAADAPGAGLYLARSDDGGLHWRRMARVEGFDCGGPDRSTITVDPRRGWVYVTWTHYVEDAACSGSIDPTKTILRWARSTDGGAHVGRPVDITTGGQGQTPSSAVLRNGELLVVHQNNATNDVGNAECHGFTSRVVAVRFTPAGRRLGSAAALSNVCHSTGGVMPNGAAFVPITDPSVAVDPVSGRAMVAVPSISPTAQGVLVGTSADGGRTWRARVVVGLPGSNATMPAVASGRGGRAALTWLEIDPGGLYRPVLAASEDSGVTWSAPIVLASVPSAGNLHPFSPLDPYGIGHYIGLAVGSDGIAHATWPDLRPDARAPGDVDVWTRSVRVP
jgi:hypothetical protein